MQQDSDLAARYTGWDTEDLLRAATAEASDFTPEALAAMHQELERRSHAADPEPAMDAGGPPAAAAAPAGVRGFLFVLSLLLGMESIKLLQAGADGLAGPYPPIYRLIAGGWICLGVYGMVCCLLLVRKDRRAPSRAARWFVAVVVLAIAYSLYDYSVTGTVRALFLLPILHSGIWLAYLARSKRVQATFGTTAGW